MSPETIDREQRIQRRRNPWKPAAHAAPSGEYRCRSCDNE